MPELPEVETIKRGLEPHLKNVIILQVVIRNSQLRWPVPSTLNNDLKQQKILQLSRRGKYLLIQVTTGTLLIHLGMSGSLQLVDTTTPIKTHDHVDFVLANQKIMRYHDPRRFGAILWTTENPLHHPLLQSIGIEPLDTNFTAYYLHNKALKRKVPIKSFLMNGKIVAGIGNIYAAEALFLAHLHPTLPANRLTLAQCEQLAKAIKNVLIAAITAGGTTLKDFVNSKGQPGYFSQALAVYGRATLPCRACNTPLKSLQLGQRSTVFCASCQPQTK